VNLVSVLLAAASERPDAVAIEAAAGGDRATYAELEGTAARVAGGLTGAGVQPGDRVVVVAGNDLTFVHAYLGVLWAGAIAVPLNPHAPAGEIEARAAGVGASLVIGTAPGARSVDELAASDPLGVEVERDDDDVAVLLFTSGTAGSPRAAMLTHGNLAANIGQVQGQPGLRVGPDDVGLAALPFFHVFGLNVALGVALAAGMRSVLLDPFDAATAVALVKERGVTILAGVPAMFAAILELGAASAPVGALSSLRLAVSGAAPLPGEVVEGFASRFGIRLAEGYGLTEAAPIVCTNAADPTAAPGSIGPPLPGVEVRLVDGDGHDVVVGDPGELWVRGPNVFVGYWNDPDTTARVLVDGWLRTGDVGVADEHGALRLVDRIKDLVIVSGFNVFPAEVEDVLLAHPDVAEAAVVGEPHPRTGEAVVAWVVLSEGARLDPGALREHVASRLARYKVPARVELVEMLPRNLSGKVLRRELRDATRKPE
jgi:long-chain acyl-CoA synthetase